MPRPPIQEGIAERFLSFRHARLATGSGWSPHVVCGEPNNVDFVIAAAHVRPANHIERAETTRSENTGVTAATESVVQIFGPHCPVRVDLPFVTAAYSISRQGRGCASSRRRAGGTETGEASAEEKVVA